MRESHEFELRHLAAFVAVAEELHFGRAARRLHTAQPALSRTIQQLEARLGCTLLRRTTRSVALTPAGRALAERASTILAECEAAARATSDVAAGRAGRLRAAFSGATMLHTLSEVLRTFQRAQPTWRLELTELPTTDQIQALVEGRIDVGFFLAGPALPDEIEAVTVATDRACIGVPADHALASRETLRLSDVGDERLILFPRERNPVLYDEIVDHVSAGHTRSVDVEEVSSRQIAAGLVAAGIGVSTFTEAMRHLCGPDVTLIPQVDPERTTTTLMGWAHDTPNPLLDHVPV